MMGTKKVGTLSSPLKKAAFIIPKKKQKSRDILKIFYNISGRPKKD
jgi:hypothetical protein